MSTPSCLARACSVTRLALLAALLAAPRAAFAIAASQAWVEAYVSNYVANSSSQLVTTSSSVKSNNTTYISIGGGVLSIEDSTDAALRVTNITAAASANAITNGTTFVWNGNGAYINPLGTISCTTTNMVYNGVGSTYDESSNTLTFNGYFDALPILIQPSTSLAITNSLTEVNQ